MAPLYKSLTLFKKKDLEKEEEKEGPGSKKQKA